MDFIDKRDEVVRTMLKYGIKNCDWCGLKKTDLADCAEEIVKNLHPLKTVKQGETLLLDNKLDVEVITPESSVLIKDSRDGMLRWVDKERLKRK